MKCPVCGAAERIHDTRDMPYTYSGKTILIPAVTGDYCSACGEVVLDAAESTRTTVEMMEFEKQVKRSGFMAGQISVPDDFDRMGEVEIAKMFEGKPER